MKWVCLKSQPPTIGKQQSTTFEHCCFFGGTGPQISTLGRSHPAAAPLFCPSHVRQTWGAPTPVSMGTARWPRCRSRGSLPWSGTTHRKGPAWLFPMSPRWWSNCRQTLAGGWSQSMAISWFGPFPAMIERQYPIIKNAKITQMSPNFPQNIPINMNMLSVRCKMCFQMEFCKDDQGTHWLPPFDPGPLRALQQPFANDPSYRLSSKQKWWPHWAPAADGACHLPTSRPSANAWLLWWSCCKKSPGNWTAVFEVWKGVVMIHVVFLDVLQNGGQNWEISTYVCYDHMRAHESIAILRCFTLLGRSISAYPDKHLMRHPKQVRFNTFKKEQRTSTQHHQHQSPEAPSYISPSLLDHAISQTQQCMLPFHWEKPQLALKQEKSSKTPGRFLKTGGLEPQNAAFDKKWWKGMNNLFVFYFATASLQIHNLPLSRKSLGAKIPNVSAVVSAASWAWWSIVSSYSKIGYAWIHHGCFTMVSENTTKINYIPASQAQEWLSCNKGLASHWNQVWLAYVAQAVLINI